MAVHFIWPCIQLFRAGRMMIQTRITGLQWNVENLNPFFQTISPNLRYAAVILSVAAMSLSFTGTDNKRVHYGFLKLPPNRMP